MSHVSRPCSLLGNAPVTGKNFDHRKRWLDEQLIHQARHFGIDLLCQAMLSNHFHLVLRSRPDAVAEWDDAEIACRWLMLCPECRDTNGKPEEPSEFELNHICKDKSKLKVLRSRLSDISLWMRLLSQHIAQRANKGFLPMSTADYLSLLDWTARQTRKDKRGATPKKIAPIFDRLGISAEIWCRLVKDFGKLFCLAAGQPQRIDEHRSKGSSRRYRMRREARELLATV
ncbi:MAG: hypothetical protein R3C17_11645 [Planctomycetaceae bacterium]